MSDILPEPYFTETTPRGRSLEFLDRQLKSLAKASYKVSGLEKGKMPERDFPLELNGGLSKWIETRSKEGEKIEILDIGAGEANLAKVLSGKKGVKVVSSDIYPPKSEKPESFVQLDANKPLPFASQSFSICVCSFVLPYLEDPIKTINEMIRTTKTGGYILLNGAKKVYLGKVGQQFFSSNNPLKDRDLIIYNSDRWSGGDWILIRVNDPNYRFDVTLDMNESFTVQNKGDKKMNMPVYGAYGTIFETRDIKDLATFVYQHN